MTSVKRLSLLLTLLFASSEATRLRTTVESSALVSDSVAEERITEEDPLQEAAPANGQLTVTASRGGDFDIASQASVEELKKLAHSLSEEHDEMVAKLHRMQGKLEMSVHHLTDTIKRSGTKSDKLLTAEEEGITELDKTATKIEERISGNANHIDRVQSSQLDIADAEQADSESLAKGQTYLVDGMLQEKSEVERQSIYLQHTGGLGRCCCRKGSDNFKTCHWETKVRYTMDGPRCMDPSEESFLVTFDDVAKRQGALDSCAANGWSSPASAEAISQSVAQSQKAMGSIADMKIGDRTRGRLNMNNNAAAAPEAEDASSSDDLLATHPISEDAEEAAALVQLATARRHKKQRLMRKHSAAVEDVAERLQSAEKLQHVYARTNAQ